MRRWVLMVLGLALVGCGDEGAGDVDDPWRYEMGIDEWAEVCPTFNRAAANQFFTAHGEPFCPEDWDALPAEFCLRYYGGPSVRAWLEDEAPACGDDEQVIICWEPHPLGGHQTTLLCVSYAEAAARAL